MTLEDAIKAAIGYEEKVRDAYAQACDKATNAVGQRVFRVLAKEEQGHVDYLHHKLTQLRETGAVKVEGLETAIPSPEAIAEAVTKLDDRLAAKDRGDELQMLKKVLEVEIETSEFYKRMVEQFDDDGQALFARFLEIEQGHQTIIQAEIDAVSGSGFWFGMPEFHLEG